MSGHVREINNLKTEIKRMNARLKQLRAQKKTVETRLYHYMTKRELDTFEGIKIKTVTPKEPRKRKPLKKKRSDALALFTEIGIPNPEEFWEEFQATQKYSNNTQNPTSNDDYDHHLGF